VAALLGRLLKPRENGSVILLTSLIVIGIGAVDSLRLSALITLLVFGVMIKNYVREFRLATFDTGAFGRLFVVVLFVASGALLPLQWQPQWALPVLAFVFVRLTAKTVAVTVLARPSGISLKKGGLIGMMLMPLSITEFELVRDVAHSNPEIGGELGAIVFPAIVLMELIGPVISQWALRLAHEAYEPVREAA
jgi:Kef-type K+ transport system membrane component KefB